MTNIENINISINEHIEEILRLERQRGRAYNAGDIEHYFQLSTKINMRRKKLEDLRKVLNE